jgi:hypothetical protein
MEPDSWPLDPVATAAVVLSAIDEIDESSEDEQVALLSDLMCLAWGSLWAQSQ